MSNVPPELHHLERLSAAEIEAEVQKFRAVDPEALTDDELTRVCALHAIARRKTAGPPKSKTSTPKVKEMSLDDLSSQF